MSVSLIVTGAVFLAEGRGEYTQSTHAQSGHAAAMTAHTGGIRGSLLSTSRTAMTAHTGGIRGSLLSTSRTAMTAHTGDSDR